MQKSSIDEEMLNLNLNAIRSRTHQLKDVNVKTPVIKLHSP